MDANYPTDNSSQTENNVNTAIKNFDSETSQNIFLLEINFTIKIC